MLQCLLIQIFRNPRVFPTRSWKLASFSHAAIAFSCTVLYASSRGIPFSTRSCSSWPENTSPCVASRFFSSAPETPACPRQSRSSSPACNPPELSSPAESRAPPNCAKYLARATAQYFRTPQSCSNAPTARAAYLFARHRIPLVRHRRTPALFPAKRLFRLAHFRPLQVRISSAIFSSVAAISASVLT